MNAINMPKETKKPMHLPKKEHWTTQLIKEFHKRLFHAGTLHTLSQIEYIYWIPQGRSTVKAVMHKCGVCRPYIAPFYVEENKVKVWICIFTCVTIRALHLEIVDDMTAEQFLMVLQRFISRRNTPDTIILDNAPQFKLTKPTVDKAWQQSITHENVQKFTSDAGIKWKVIVEFSPWMGGFYERLVGMVK